MDELDWWTSPIDHHGHPDGPRPDECAVCALQVDRDRLRVERDALHEWGHQLETSGKALVAELERLGADAIGLRMLLTEATAERDQLRAVADAAREFMVATPLALRERRNRLLAALAALDVSADIGGEGER